MNISIGVQDLKVDQLIRVLDLIEATSSFLIEDGGRKFTFAELVDSTKVYTKEN